MARLRFYLPALAILALNPSPTARAQDTTQKIAGKPSEPPKTPSEARPLSPIVITTPANNALVRGDAVVSGTLDPTITDDIWVFVLPAQAPTKGWPQSPDAAEGAPAALNKQRNQWSTPVGFGGPPQSYEIAVYTATKATSARIGKLLKKWAKTNNYPGMTLNQLDGLEERARITVRKA